MPQQHREEIVIPPNEREAILEQLAKQTRQTRDSLIERVQREGLTFVPGAHSKSFGTYKKLAKERYKKLFISRRGEYKGKQGMFVWLEDIKDDDQHG